MAYLDHAATTPMRSEALTAYLTAARDVGNASSLHTYGRRARRRVEESREAVAEALGASPFEVIFTSGGTESDNLALKGIFWARRAASPSRVRIITTAVEHHAILEAVSWLAREQGAQPVLLPVDTDGRVAPESLGEVLDELGPETALVSAVWANNEVGTVQPIAELAAVPRSAGVPFHTDAIQAVGQVPVDFSPPAGSPR